MSKTPREIGEEVGYGWAELMHSTETAMLDDDGVGDPVAIVAAGTGQDVPAAVRRIVRKSVKLAPTFGLRRGARPDRQPEFWDGFVEGAQRFEAETVSP